MDKQEYREFLNEIKRGYDAKDYDRVTAYADAIDLGKLKEPRILEMIADSYEQQGNVDRAVEALELAYRRNNTSKQIAYRLSELSIRTGELDDAVEYYEDYCRLSNNNNKRLILKYEIGKAAGRGSNDLIKVLEAYTSKEKDERWEYELARLYHESGQEKKCVEACDNICLWYADGEYVKKALELKFSHEALSPQQQAQYEKIMQDYLEPEERAAREQEPEPEEMDDVAKQLSEEYFEENKSEEEAEKAAAPEIENTINLQETRIIPIGDIMEELEKETAENGEEPSAAEESGDLSEIQDVADAAEISGEGASDIDEIPDEKDGTEAVGADEEENAPEKNSNSITLEELRAMIHAGNSKKAEAGVFFTYSEPTAEDIAEEEAQKAAREEAKRLAEEAAAEAAAKAAREAAEEEAAKEAAEAAAREAMRLEEEAKAEAVLRENEEAEAKAAEETEMKAAEEVAEETTEDTMAEDEAEKMADEEEKESTEVTSAVTEQEETAAETESDTINAAAEAEGMPAEESAAEETVHPEKVMAPAAAAALGVMAAAIDDEDEAVSAAAIRSLDGNETDTSDREIEETTFINREEVLARLDAEEAEESEKTETDLPDAEYEFEDEDDEFDDDEVSTLDFAKAIEAVRAQNEQKEESLGFTALIDAISEEVEIDGIPQETSEKTVEEKDDDEIGATQIFTREELERALNKESEQKFATPEEELGATIGQIMEDANAAVEMDMEETRSIRIVLPVAAANKLGTSSVKLSQYASAVEKPALMGNEEQDEPAAASAPRIIENVDFSYIIPISRDDDGQLGLNIEYLEFGGEDEDVEGQMSFDDFLNSLDKKIDKSKTRVLDVEAERLRQIQEAVNLTSPVKLPYSMDDLMFDDIEMSDIDGNVEVPEGDVFQFDPESIGIIPSDEEILAKRAQEEAESESEAEKTVEAESEPEAEEPAETESEPEAEETVGAESESESEKTDGSDSDSIAPEIAAAVAAGMVAGEISNEASAAENNGQMEEAGISGPAEEIEEPDISLEDMSEAEKAIAMFELNQAEDSPEETEDIENELFDVMAELGVSQDESKEENVDELLEGDTFEEMFGELMTDGESCEKENGESLETEEALIDEENVPEEEKTVITSPGGYSLPDDVRKNMAEFLLIDGMEQNICNVVSDIAETKENGNETGGNLVVTGDIKSGKTFLAIEIIKAVTEKIGRGNGKVAKVQAELLNGKNIERVFEKINGSDLIIENIGFLADETVNELTDAISSGKYESMVVIEGNQLAVESLFTTFPEFAELFNNRIDISELSIVQWADIAIDYAYEKGFVLDDMAKLALHAKINEINVPTVRLGYDDVMDIMDDAMDKAEKRNSGKLFAAFKKNEEVKQEIIESDFM